MIDEKGEQVTLHYNVKRSLDKYTIYLHSPPEFTFAALLTHTIKRCTYSFTCANVIYVYSRHNCVYKGSKECNERLA